VDGRFVRVDGKEREQHPSTPKSLNCTKASVGSSLYAAAKDNRVPEYIIAELTRMFSYDVDFQRQVKPNDTFEVFYGNPLTGSSTKRKVLHYAQLTLSGVTKTYYRYVNADGQVERMRTARALQPCSRPRSPGQNSLPALACAASPLGYTKMHTGVDFGVPTAPLSARPVWR
jgi:hypothetical protein